MKTKKLNLNEMQKIEGGIDYFCVAFWASKSAKMYGGGLHPIAYQRIYNGCFNTSFATEYW